MATLVSSNRAMARQPLHPFFTRPPRQQGPLQVYDSDADSQLQTQGATWTPKGNDLRFGLEPNEDQEPLRKRQRTDSVERPSTLVSGDNPQTLGADVNASDGTPTAKHDSQTGHGTPLSSGGADELSTKLTQARKQSAASHTPSKQQTLRLRADGKLKSPDGSDPPESGTRTRKRRSGAKNAKHLTLKYGKTPHTRLALGRKIDQILLGRLRSAVPRLVTPVSEPEAVSKPASHVPTITANAVSESKITHPFFLGKAAKPVPVETDARPSLDNSKSDMEVDSRSTRAGTDRLNKPAYPSSFGTAFAKPPKAPGILDAPWPYQSMQHVRGLESGSRPSAVESLGSRRTGRKAKGRQAYVTLDDEVLASRMNLVRERRLALKQSDESLLSQDRLQQPCKHLITGRDLQVRLKQELQICPDPETSNAAPAKSSSLQDFTSATQHLYAMVDSSRSAFDRFECDTHDWCHKYAPKRTKDVLQSQLDLGLLRDWLRTRNTDQVDTGLKASSSRLDAAKELAAKRRKRKIKDELEDFIVQSEEEPDLADDVSEPEDPTSLGVLASGPSTVNTPIMPKRLRPSNLGSTRAVLVTGPHGCGKTASIYAIAAELGFEIFEINSGTRRNGRDIMERVGDMTRNHLVSNENLVDLRPEFVECSEGPVPVDDIVDPKQQSVASFFQSKPTSRGAKKNPTSKKNANKPINEKPAPKARKQQKQSLILLEEVDVLFEEDKPFWTTVFTLIVQSRRPIIMTCTDPDRLPLADFVDTVCLSLLPQTRGDIADYLVCLAANEGHLLARAEASRVVAIRNGDLRGAITDLQFWCQMAIGDSKAGIGWFMEANKANANRSESEPYLRTVSEYSYPINVSLFKRLRNRTCPLENEPKLLCEAFDFKGYDAFEHDSLVLGQDPDHLGSLRDTLELQDLRSDILSAADIMPMALREFDRLDCSKRILSEKSRGEFSEGFTLLQTDPVQDLSGVAKDVVFTMKAATYCADDTIRVKSRRKHLIEAVLKPKSSLYAHQHNIRKHSEAVFDALTDPPDGNPWSQQRGPGISVFARPFANIATDVAPILRSIARSDLQLEDERNRLSSVLAEPGHKTKRQRTTRAARAALEGGNKESTRKERWLPKELDYKAVLKTGGHDWPIPAFGDEVDSLPGSTLSNVASGRTSSVESPDELS